MAYRKENLTPVSWVFLQQIAIFGADEIINS